MHEILQKAMEKVRPLWTQVDEVKLKNTRRVLEAFQESSVSDYHFTAGTGYGYNDAGRETLEAVYARVFHAESALVRPQIVSGTHAIALCLFGNLLPGDELVSLSGSPYDTLQKVIGSTGAARTSLLRSGVKYREVHLLPSGRLDWDEVKTVLARRPKMAMIQRSRGYSWRPSLSVDEIGELTALVKELSPDTIVFVDNCYGEFVEDKEPTDAGVDLMAGSLIKNPGGTLAPSGGYIVGLEDLVKNAADRLTAPGLGREVGPTFGLVRTLLQGLFLAPLTVGEALAGAILTAQVFSDLGFKVSPLPGEKRTDIVQAVQMGDKHLLEAVCREIQAASPVDSHVRPEPWEMPGYEHQVIMAAGTFVQGASSELSADAPMREPYVLYLQGGISKEHVVIALERIILILSRGRDLPG